MSFPVALQNKCLEIISDLMEHIFLKMLPDTLQIASLVSNCQKIKDNFFSFAKFLNGSSENNCVNLLNIIEREKKNDDKNNSLFWFSAIIEGLEVLAWIYFAIRGLYVENYHIAQNCFQQFLTSNEFNLFLTLCLLLQIFTIINALKLNNNSTFNSIIYSLISLNPFIAAILLGFSDCQSKQVSSGEINNLLSKKLMEIYAEFKLENPNKSHSEILEHFNQLINDEKGKEIE